MLSYVVINCYITINNDCLWLMNNNHREGESTKVGFNGGIKLEFRGDAALTYEYLESNGFLYSIRLPANVLYRIDQLRYCTV